MIQKAKSPGVFWILYMAGALGSDMVILLEAYKYWTNAPASMLAPIAGLMTFAAMIFGAMFFSQENI